MKSKLMLSTVVILISGLFTSNLLADSKADITDVIEKSYFNGAFNEQDTKSMKEGFHPDFAIFSPNGTELKKYPITEWVASTERWKASPEYDKERAKADCKIVSLDVTGVCASAKIEIRENGKLLWTDYLSLLKFENGWKIVTKVYNEHD